MLQNWKNEILKHSVKTDEHNIILGEIHSSPGVDFHNTKEKGANLRELSSVSSHQSNWETPYYENILKDYLCDLDPDNSVIADIGCGDGRFTDYLLRNGFKKIIAIDAHHVPLTSLSNHLKKTRNEDKVLVINSSLEKIPLKESSIDAFLAINVFYYLGDVIRLAQKEVISKLKKEGIAIITEHNFEALLLRALVFNEFKDFIKVLEDSKFKEVNYSTNFWFDLNRKESLPAIWKELGLKEMDVKGISIFHQFLGIIKKIKQIPEDTLNEKRESLKGLFDYLEKSGNFNKTNIYKLIRNDL